MKYVTLLLLLTAAKVTFSQSFFYLEDIKLKEKPDFITNEVNAIKAIDYMASTPINDKDMDRKACTRFILRYAEGCPDVTVRLGEYISKLDKKNLDLLGMFIGYWVKSYVNNKTGTDDDHALYTATELYKYVKETTKNGIKSNETIKSLTDAGDNGKIPDWLKTHK